MMNLPWDLSRKVIPVVRKTARPTEDDINYNVPTLWLDTTNNKAYILVDVTSSVATWSQAIGASVNLDFQNSVKSIATATSAPPTEVSGDRYIIGATGTPHANWDGALNNDIVEFDGAKWVATTPNEGMICEVEDVNTIYLYLTSWAAWQNQATTTTSNVTFNQVTTANVLAPAASLVLKPTTDGTTAIQIADKDGTVCINVDTTNNRVGINDDSPSSILGIGGTPGVGAITQGITFGDGDTGIYERGDDQLALYLNGAEQLVWDTNELCSLKATGVESSVRLRFAAGTISTPTYAFQQDQNTGMWNAAADNLELVTAGVSRVRIDSAGNTGLNQTSFGTSAAKVLAMASGTAPTTAITDGIQLWSADYAAGDARLYIMGEGSTQAVSIGKGEITLPDAGGLILPITLTTDHTAVGEKITATAGENLVFGNNCYLKSDGKWWKADASASSTMPGTAMAIATISADATGLFLKWGYARDDSAWSSMTVGADIYTSETAGALTQTAPTPTTSATVILQRVGKAPSSNSSTVGVIFYNPDPLTFEVGVDIIDLGTATPTTILFSSMTSSPITWMANHSSDQTITFAAPTAADVGKTFRLVKNGTGAGKLILDAPSTVYLNSAGASSTDGGTAYLAASAYGSMTWMVTSATSLQLLSCDGSITFT